MTMSMTKEEIRIHEIEMLYQMKCFESDYFDIHPDESVWFVLVSHVVVVLCWG